MVFGYPVPRGMSPHPWKCDGACLPEKEDFPRSYESLYTPLEDEREELTGEIRKLGLTPENFFERNLKELNDRIMDRKGEMLSAITHEYYEPILCADGTEEEKLYTIRKMLHIGLIGDKTRIGFDSVSPFERFILNLDIYHIHHIHCIDDFYQEGSRLVKMEEADGLNMMMAYSTYSRDARTLVYFRERPPAVPLDNFVGGLVGTKPSVISKCEKPRLQFYIGDEETKRMLRREVEEEVCRELENILGKELR